MQSTHLREHNLSLCLRTLSSAPEPLSRASLAARTGLTKPTVSKLIEELIGAGLVAEDAPLIHGTGRPMVPLRPARGTLLAIGLEVTADGVSCLATDLTGEVLAAADEPLAAAGNPPSLVIEACGRLVAQVRGAASAESPTPLPVVGACAALPGRIDPADGSVLSAPGLGWSDVPFVARLRERPELAGLAVLAQNDNRLSVLTELDQRPGQSFLYLRGHTGVGGAVVLGGRVLEGEHGWAGEFGHMVVEPGGALCRCGRRGCLEAYVSAHALRERAGLGPGASLEELVDALARESGDGRADGRSEVIGTIGRAIGTAVANALNVLDLSTVVLSGHLAPIGEEIGPVISETVAEHALATEAGPITIERSDAPADLALRGAARWALEPVFAAPGQWIARAA
ncbi:ROK family transcriptional regulator [Brachybacterium halotolerans subsp. kimchii]|uniref:ROK family transcriptional regulator n=1 Tax=Brachybacterium halotolerans TaxID=2795215 RepID=UPI001E29FE63|nr:ROK family transcriptional regulator [Brachybacterium halotolerans]UEJ81616.1 ROK family transcriptional regulator [Brachybacterium halotolerans subsp. kimchii]